MQEIKIFVGNYSRAVQKLIKGIEKADDELYRDGVIQRFVPKGSPWGIYL